MDSESPKGTPRLLRLATDWRVQAALGAIALGLAVAVGAAIGQRRRSAHRESGPAVPSLMPEAYAIGDSWRAARAGDAEAYLDGFTREAREEREAELARLGREAFCSELRATAEAAFGVEWGPPQPAADGALRFPVSVLHEDGVEEFDYVVVKVGAGWRIRSVEGRGRRPVAPPVTERLGPPGGQGGQK